MNQFCSDSSATIFRKYSKAVDPELAAAPGTYYSGSGVGYTMPLTLTLGLNINF